MDKRIEDDRAIVTIIYDPPSITIGDHVTASEAAKHMVAEVDKHFKDAHQNLLTALADRDKEIATVTKRGDCEYGKLLEELKEENDFESRLSTITDAAKRLEYGNFQTTKRCERVVDSNGHECTLVTTATMERLWDALEAIEGGRE